MTTPIDRSVVEAILFASDEPLSVAQIKKAIGEVTVADVREALESLRAELDERRAGFALVEVAGGFQLRTRPEHAGYIRQLRSERPPRLSKPALETLAVVSYKQPVTRAEIEAIRRVDTGAVLKTLVDRKLLKVVGHKDVPGRPVLYGTSREFLEAFHLKSLKELPTLKEIREVAAEMGDALDVPRDLLPPELAAAFPSADDQEAARELVAADFGGENSPLSESSPAPAGAEEDESMETENNDAILAGADTAAPIEGSLAPSSAGPEDEDEDLPDGDDLDDLDDDDEDFDEDDFDDDDDDEDLDDIDDEDE